MIEVGVMIGELLGNNESINVIKASEGQEIADLRLDEDLEALIFDFTNGSQLRMWDDGQSCCESRYMTTDDDLAFFKSARFHGAEVRPGKVEDKNGDVHETDFLVINTSKGQFTVETHVEHNGYYGGFFLRCSRAESK